MKISQRTIQQLSLYVTGDNEKAPYRSGPKLVALFNDFGFDHKYGPGFPSRRPFAEEQICELNDTPAMKRLIESVFDPLDFVEANEQIYKEYGQTLQAHDQELDVSKAISDFNDYLRRDGFEIGIIGGVAKVRKTEGSSVEFGITDVAYPSASEDFISEQLEKCEQKLVAGDNRGAITNARTLCEEVLLDLEAQILGEQQRYDGKLPKLYKRVAKKLHMDPDRFKEHEPILELLRGLTSIIGGLSGMSNSMSDRHGGGQDAKPHHALLAVNAAKTVCSFLVASFTHQFVKQKISNNEKHDS